MWLLLIIKYIGPQGVKLEKGDVEAPDSAIRVRILYELDLILYFFMMLIVSRNGESSLMFSITTKTYKIYICSISTRSRSL